MTTWDEYYQDCAKQHERHAVALYGDKKDYSMDTFQHLTFASCLLKCFSMCCDSASFSDCFRGSLLQVLKPTTCLANCYSMVMIAENLAITSN